MAVEVRTFDHSDRVAVIDLWQQTGLTLPWNDPDLDIDRKLATDPDGFLVGTIDGRVVTTVMAGYDGHRGWVNYLAVGPEAQGGGVGAHLMSAAESLFAGRGCPKVNLQVRRSNRPAVEFYRAIGYEVDDVVSLGRRLVDDQPD